MPQSYEFDSGHANEIGDTDLDAGEQVEGMTSTFTQSAVRHLSNACRSAVDRAILSRPLI